MKNQPTKTFTVTHWILIVIVGLLIETCLLAAIAGIFLMQRGRLASPIYDSALETAMVPLEQTLPLEGTRTSNQEENQTIQPTSQETEESSAVSVPTQLENSNQDPTPWSNPPPGKIAYVCFDGKFDQICLMDTDGGNRRQLTDIPATNFYPSISADGEQIVYSSNRDGNFEIYIFDLKSGENRQLTEDMGNLYAPDIAPNGNRIIFTHETAGVQNIWVMRGDGGNARPLTDSGSDIDPTWSPNGEQIAFTSARQGIKQIYLMNANGNNPRSIELEDPPKIGGRVSWSPDGNWLAFYGGASGAHEIFLTSVDGRLFYQLTQGGDNLGPSFSPDNEWLAFTSFRDGNNQIYIMRTDGSNQTRLTRSKNSDWQPRWGK